MIASNNFGSAQEQFKLKDNTSFITLLLFASVAYGLFSQYLWVSVVGGISLAVIISQLWKPYIPPVLLYLFGYHWIQIFGSVIYADYLGKTLDVLYDSKEAEILVAATLGQLTLMASFLSRVFKPAFSPDLDTLKAAAEKLDTKKIITAYIVTTLIFPTLIAITYSNSSLNQLVQSFAVLRKVLLMMLIFTFFLKKTGYRNMIILIVVLEFVLSFVSYFSSFKEVIFFVVLTYLTVNPYFDNKLILRLIPIGIFLVFFMIFWSSVKGGYRAFLNQGSMKQEVRVSTGDAFDYLGEKATEFDTDSFKTGGEVLLHRMQYMQQYSTVYARVPDIIEHSNGENLSSTISFLFLPRFLNPNKSRLDPSTKTSYYTGRQYKNAEQGTSISMGYFCDLYIDFGILLMIIPLMIITFLIGKAANYIVNNKQYNLIFVYSLFIGIFLSMGTFESDIIFYLGSVRNYIVFMILGKIFIFAWLNKYVTSNR